MADGTPTHADYGRMGGAPIRSGSVVSAHGGTLSSVHVARLRALAERSTGRDRDHLLAAIECIQTLTRKNRRLGAQVGATQRRAVLTHRGLALSGPAEAVAEEITELASVQPVTVYQMPRKRVRVTTAKNLPANAEIHRIGTYDIGCDYRQVVEDVREALGQ